MIFIADACHSGDSYRDMDTRADEKWTQRKVPMVDFELNPTDEKKTYQKIVEMDLENFYFFAATKSKQVSVEGKIEGKPHGVLSWAFAKALQQADANDDQNLSVAELSSFIHEEVKQLTNSRQFTDILIQRQKHHKKIQYNEKRDKKFCVPIDHTLFVEVQNFESNIHQLKTLRMIEFLYKLKLVLL